MAPDLQPVLHGSLLTLRPLRENDLEALYQAASDPLIWEQHPEPDRYKREVFMKYFESGITSKGALVAIDNETGEIVGCSRFYNFDEQTKQITVGYTFLARKCWANGYNKDMKRSMLDHAFSFADAVLFDIGEHNYRSQMAVRKTGATLHRTEPGRATFLLTKEQWTANTEYR